MTTTEPSAASPLRTLLVGCGAVSEILYQGALARLQAEGLATVVGLVDPVPARLDVLARAFPRARRYPQLEQALADTSPHVAIIASPPRFHREQTLLSLRHGCHVLCEKPLAVTAADCDDMIEEARSHNRQLSVGLFRRHYPSAQAIRSLLQAGVLGRPVSFAVQEGSIFRWPWQSEAAPASEAFGGVLADTGPHALDLLTWWLGPLQLESYSDDALGHVEVNCRLELTAQSGARGTVLLSRDTALPNRHLITCERGWVAYSCDDPTRFTWGWEGAPFPATTHLSLPAAAHPLMVEPDRAPLPVDSLHVYFTEQLRNLCAAIRGDEQLVVSVEDARDGVRIITECQAQRRLIDPAWLGDDERERMLTVGGGLR
jgi:predicted dehydrogenase